MHMERSDDSFCSEVLEPQRSKDSPPPMAGDSSGTATSTRIGSFAIGVDPITASPIYSIPLGLSVKE